MPAIVFGSNQTWTWLIPARECSETLRQLFRRACQHRA
jgi:hypothetical protein